MMWPIFHIKKKIELAQYGKATKDNDPNEFFLCEFVLFWHNYQGFIKDTNLGFYICEDSQISLHIPKRRGFVTFLYRKMIVFSEKLLNLLVEIDKLEN